MKKNLLKDYHKKRDFKITREPKGKKKNTAKRKPKLSFVIQEHHARRLHYDFRLEWEGVLKSWAVPKGPSENPTDKRLAVQTEDHPLEYGKFKGTIPEGEYGAGEVFIWDSGIWEPIGDPAEGFKKGHLEFKLKGKKLHGKWMLIRTHYQESENKKNWLLIKRSDEVENSENTTKKKAMALSGSDPWPDFISPQLPRLVTDVPEEATWVHEIKFDGYRMQGHLKNNIAHLFSRNALDWSNSFPNILEALGKLIAKNAIVDGEIVAPDEEGSFHFQKLQNSLTLKKDQDLRYYIFDLLYLNGQDLRTLPLIERKEKLRALLQDVSPFLIFSEHLTEEGKNFFKVSCEHHLEGIVSKLADSPYRSGRNDLWVKTKCSLRQEFVIGGFTDAQGTRQGFGALLLGIYEGKKLKYVGKVGTGFDNQTLIEFKKNFTKLIQKDSPFALKSPKGKNTHWMKPVMIAEINFAQWTKDQILRAPVFKGLRIDKAAEEINMEKPKEIKEVSSPDKVLFKKEKITKKEVAEFYNMIAKEMIPYLKDRPLSLVRCPNGSEGTCFFQKHITGKIPSSFNTFPVQEDKGQGIYFSIDSANGLRELVQLNAFEIHAWNCRKNNLMRPDQIVMDFDPGPDVAWKEVVSAAKDLKIMLEKIGLKSFVKLTGGKGLHVHVPLDPRYDWDQVKAFSQSLALQMVSQNPTKYTANMSKKLRKGKIFIDYLRNGYGATAIVPYSLRAKPLSAVALPVEWSELLRIKGPQEFTMKKALRKIKKRKVDPWKGMLKLHQNISILKPLAKNEIAA